MLGIVRDIVMIRINLKVAVHSEMVQVLAISKSLQVAFSNTIPVKVAAA
jgi:hypothetical protein